MKFCMLLITITVESGELSTMIALLRRWLAILNWFMYRHLGNSVLNVGTGQGLETLGRPTLMITDANNADVALPKRKSRDTALFSK